MLDDWFFDNVYQKFADWFQKMTCKNNFFLGNVCFVLALISIWFFYKDPLLGLVGIFSSAKTIRINNQLSKKYDQIDGLVRHVNPLRILPVAIRIRTVFISIMMLQLCFVFTDIVAGRVEMVQFLFALFLLNSGMYFSACTPLPPQKSKLGQWLQSIKLKLSKTVSAEPVTVPEPMPV